MSYETKTGWESIFYLSYQTGNIDDDDGATSGIFAGSDSGILGVSGDHGLLLDQDAQIMPGQDIINTPKKTGLAEDQAGTGKEYIQGRRTPTVQLIMGLDEYNFATFGWLTVHQGISQGVTPGFTKTLVPPVAGQSAPEVYASIGHRIGDATVANGYALHGCICTGLQVAGNEGERMILTADMVGRSYVDNYNHSASDNTLPAVAEHMFWNYTWTLSGSAVSLLSFSLNINPNVAVKHYNSLIPDSYILGKFKTTGEIKIPMTDDAVGDNVQIDNFINGTVVPLIGTYTSKVTFTLSCRYNGDPDLDPADELMLTLPFDCVRNATTPSFDIDITDSVDRGIT